MIKTDTHILLGPHWSTINFILKNISFSDIQLSYLLEEANRFLGFEFVEQKLKLNPCDWCNGHKNEKAIPLFYVMSNNMDGRDLRKILMSFLNLIHGEVSDYHKDHLKSFD